MYSRNNKHSQNMYKPNNGYFSSATLTMKLIDSTTLLNTNKSLVNYNAICGLIPI